MKRVLGWVLRVLEVVAAVALASAAVLAIILALIGKWSLPDFVYSLKVLLAFEGLLIALAGTFMISGFGWVSTGRPGVPYMRGSIPREEKKSPSLGKKMIAVGLALFFISLLWLSIA